ncbi:MAG: hypothetical protein V4585_20830 [Bacteroidota bacterium]
MTKSDFINDLNVKEFINYLADHWETGNIFKAGSLQYFGIKDAFNKYSWEFILYDEYNLLIRKGNSFEENREVLEELKYKIRKAFLEENEMELFVAVKNILSWGKLLGSEKKGNLKYLMEINSEGYKSILEFLTIVKKHWNRLNNDEIEIESKIKFRSNSGFTKVFSLLLDDYSIYDSRVGAAFTYFLCKKFISDIPPSLIFDLPNGREKKSKYVLNANPAIFKSTRQKNHKHFPPNVKSSWLINETVKLINENPISKKIDSRQFEAALFMIGADVSEGRMN